MYLVAHGFEPRATALFRVRDFELAGSKRPSIVLGGHSHAISMLDSVDHAPAQELRAAVLAPRQRSNQFLSDPDYVEAFAQSTKGKVAVVVWDGNQHIASFLIDSDPPFQVFQKGVVDAAHNPGRIWVSEEMLRARWRGDAAWTTDALEKLLHRLVASSDRVVLLGTPPPKSERLIRVALGGDVYFSALLEKDSRRPADVPITPGPVRVALWRVIQSVYREAADDAGALFVPVPASVMDEDGFLLEILADTSHTNSDYGAAMWHHLANALSRSNA